MSQTAQAIVASAPGPDYTFGSNWKLEEISVEPTLKDGELLVQMVASGICHSDFLTTSLPAGTPGFQYPRVAGHEGSGYVKAIGPNITKKVAVGDAVLLSFDYCNKCESCKANRPSYCSAFYPLNIWGAEDVFRSKDGQGIAGKHFGQSSCASLSVVEETSVLPCKGLIRDEEELKLFAPLGCGIQTGAGAVLNTARAEKSDRVMILGLGGVGLSAIMGAVISGCEQIIAVDKVQFRIDMAKSFGATHGLNTSGVEDFVAAFKEVTDGLGPTLIVDTTGFLPVVEAGYKSLAHRGSFVIIGANHDREYVLNVHLGTHMINGTRLLGCVEGDSVPHEFIPRLIEFYRESKLPLDKIVKFYKLDDYRTALQEMHFGETIKPVLIF